MTVASLIKCLQEMNPDVDVYVAARGDEPFERIGSVDYDDDGDVILVTE